MLLLCGCTSSSRGALKIGIDPDWYLADFGLQTAYVNGYTEDVLLELSRYSGMQFELIRTNWDNLLDGIRDGKYEAVVSTLPLYEYNLAKYDFSENFLSTGPVLIVPYQSNQTSLEQLEGDLVGVITGDPAELILAKHPTIVIRKFSSIPELLEAVALGDIEGALLDYIPAVNYISDLYVEVLQIAGKPLTNDGIHLIGKKGAINAFNKNLKSILKTKKLQKLQQKWSI